MFSMALCCACRPRGPSNLLRLVGRGEFERRASGAQQNFRLNNSKSRQRCCLPVSSIIGPWERKNEQVNGLSASELPDQQPRRLQVILQVRLRVRIKQTLPAIRTALQISNSKQHKPFFSLVFLPREHLQQRAVCDRENFLNSFTRFLLLVYFPLFLSSTLPTSSSSHRPIPFPINGIGV